MIINNIKNTLNYKIDQLEERVESMGNYKIQSHLDGCHSSIKKLLYPLEQLNRWLDHPNDGPWYQEFALLAAKLPFLVVRNLLRTFYDIASHIGYFMVHPALCLVHLARMAVDQLDKLTDAKSWAMLGVATLGGVLGHAVITGRIILPSIITGGSLFFVGTVSRIAQVIRTSKESFLASAFATSCASYVRTFLEAFATAIVRPKIL